MAALLSYAPHWLGLFERAPERFVGGESEPSFEDVLESRPAFESAEWTVKRKIGFGFWDL